MDWEDRFTLSADVGAQADATPRHLKFSFVGSGSEYFRIWIVNTLLTVVTLGIYSAWAKVRTMQYFYRSTRLDGATFDYHGNAKAILKGRGIVFVLFAVYQLVLEYSPELGGVLALALAAVFPLLLVRSLRFRMANSSYRGLRFAFTGTDRDGYTVFLLWPFLAGLTLWLLGPLAHQRLKRYQHNNTRFGTAQFAFDGTAGAFYRVYLVTAGVVLLFMVVGGLVGGGALAAVADGKASASLVFMLIALGMYAGFLLIGPFFQARLQNAVWNHTTLAPHHFRSEVKARRLFGISLTNLIFTALTLGLFYPFARVRSVRYRVESMTMVAVGALDAFVVGEQQHVGALGDAAADWYDIDIAL